MTKHTADTAGTTKKFLAAGGLAFSLVGFGLFAGVGTAVATTPDTGTYDEQVENRDGSSDTNLTMDTCWGGLVGATLEKPTSDAARAARQCRRGREE